MTNGILKANAVAREDLQESFQQNYRCIAMLCEDRFNTAGLVYLLNDVLGFYNTHNVLPGNTEQRGPTSLADAVDEIYSQCNSGVLFIVKADFPQDIPEIITNNYCLYELWALNQHSQLLLNELLQEERKREN